MSEEETVLETFDGWVDRFDGDWAYITLTSRHNGDALYAEYPTRKFVELGIYEEDPFVCKVVSRGEWSRIQIEAVPPVEITPEEALRIKTEIEKAFPGDSDEVLY